MTINEEIRDALEKVYKSNELGQTTPSASHVLNDSMLISPELTTAQDVARELMNVTLSADPRMGLCVPLISANDKDWQEPTLKLAERRAYNVFSLVQAMCNIISPEYTLDPKIECWIRCAKFLEKKLYNKANSRRQYFFLVATAIHELEKKHESENRKLTKLPSRAVFARENSRLASSTSQVGAFFSKPVSVARQYRQVSRPSRAKLSGKCSQAVARRNFATGLFQSPAGMANVSRATHQLRTGAALHLGRGCSDKLEGVGAIGYHQPPGVLLVPVPEPVLQLQDLPVDATASSNEQLPLSVPMDQAQPLPPGGKYSHPQIASNPFYNRPDSTGSTAAAAHIDEKPSNQAHESRELGMIEQHRLVPTRIAQLMVFTNSNYETIPKMKKVIKYAEKIENEVYQLAQTKQEYYDYIAEKICKVHNKFMGDVQEQQKEIVKTKLEKKLATSKVRSHKRTLGRPGKSKENKDNECNEKKI